MGGPPGGVVEWCGPAGGVRCGDLAAQICTAHTIQITYVIRTIYWNVSMGRKVRKTLNIDAIKLKRVQGFLGVDTETEAIDRMLEDYDFERTLTDLLKSGGNAFRGYRSPLARRPGK